MKINFSVSMLSQTIISLLNDDWMNLTDNVLFGGKGRSPRALKFRPGREELASGSSRSTGRRNA